MKMAKTSPRTRQKNEYPGSTQQVARKYPAGTSQVENRSRTGRKQVHWRSKASINHIQAHRKHHTRTHHSQPPYRRRQRHRPLRQPPHPPLAGHRLLLPRLHNQRHGHRVRRGKDVVDELRFNTHYSYIIIRASVRK